MTEDDWRWHMYDTVRPPLLSFFIFLNILICRLKDRIGSVIKMQSIICAEKPPTLLLKYELWVFLNLVLIHRIAGTLWRTLFSDKRRKNLPARLWGSIIEIRERRTSISLCCRSRPDRPRPSTYPVRPIAASQHQFLH